LADAATAFIGPAGAIVVAVTAIVACAGVYGASFTTGSRLLFAMSEGGQLPALFGNVHARYRTPVNAIIAMSVAVLVLALSGSFIYIVKITIITRISAYIVTCATLPLLRRRADVPKASFVLPAGQVLACVAIASCLLFLANSSMRELIDVGVAAVLGLILLAVSRIGRRTPALRNASNPLP
jgi:amino acid transporter